MHDLNLIAGFGHAANQLAKRSRYAVDLGKIRLGDECHSHGNVVPGPGFEKRLV